MTSFDRRPVKPQKEKRTALRNLVLVALVTVYTGGLAITHANEALQKGGPLGAAFVVMVVLLAAVATYGAIVFVRMLILFRRER